MNNNQVAGENSLAQINGDGMHTAEAEKVLGIETASDFGRFKDAKGLLDAYNSLQSEFTRRCQRVKELEREIENIKNSEQPIGDSEKLSNGDERKGFLSVFPEAEPHLQSLYQIAAGKGDESQGRLERAYIDKLLTDLKTQREYFTSTDYLSSVIDKSSDLKNGIIRGYLDEIYATKTNVPLISGDGKVCITPPSNPKNISEAGNLAKQIFDKYKENL